MGVQMSQASRAWSEKKARPRSILKTSSFNKQVRSQAFAYTARLGSACLHP
ncbi:hypothetical protein Hdeb2414_s0030g00708391 [Helianthus debilis subsp. tardiflorus]